MGALHSAHNFVTFLSVLQLFSVNELGVAEPTFALFNHGQYFAYDTCDMTHGKCYRLQLQLTVVLDGDI